MRLGSVLLWDKIQNKKILEKWGSLKPTILAQSRH